MSRQDGGAPPRATLTTSFLQPDPPAATEPLLDGTRLVRPLCEGDQAPPTDAEMRAAGVTMELHYGTPFGSVRLPPGEWTPEMVDAFNGMTVGRVEPPHLRDLTPEELERLKEDLAKGPPGHVVMVPPEPGPIEHMAIVKSMQRHLNRMGGELKEMQRQVAELHCENRRLVDDARDARRRQMLALESMAVMAESLARADEAAVLAREAYQTPLPLDDWHEDIGPVLWWVFPVEEAPWCGSPGDSDWPGYHTHWTPLPGVAQPDGIVVPGTRLPKE